MKRLLFSALMLSASCGALASELTVYKSPACSCCAGWIDHMEANGFEADVEHPQNLAAVKASLHIGPQYRSCHTAVSASGFVFEGHIPARYIQQFLASPPVGAIGLSVPAMPVGSPGMEVGDKFMPYQVLLLKDNGSYDEYARVSSADDAR